MKFNSLTTSKSNLDICIFTTPWVDTSIPLMAPAVLKSVIENEGFSCHSVDLNGEIKAMLDNAGAEFKDQVLKFFYTDLVLASVEDWLYDFYNSIARSVCELNPRYVGLSLFSTISQTSARWICYFIKKYNPDIKIVIGGAGCLPSAVGPSEYLNSMFDQQLIDFHIRGDAEISIIELLKGKTEYSGINDFTWTELTRNQLDQVPYPNYDDYDFSYYDEPFLAITGSRGCVRNCTFCDFIANWPKFQWRDGQRIFNEMLFQAKKYGIRYFKFSDSLTNGNVKEFRNLVDLLAQHNQQNPDQAIKWSGFYIFRNSTSTIDYDWQQLKLSGADILIVGIENFNEHIRYAMGKKFNNQAIEDSLFYAKKYGIKLLFLNVVGYINETEQDIQYIEHWLETHTHYKDVFWLKWGTTLAVLPDTYLFKNRNKLGIVMSSDKLGHDWTSSDGYSTPALRASWAKRLYEKSIALGYTVPEYYDTHFVLELMMKNELR